MQTIITFNTTFNTKEEKKFAAQQARSGQFKPGLWAVLMAGVLGWFIVSPALAQSFALAGYDSNGNLSTGFSGDGKVITSFGSGLDEKASAVAVDSAGRVVAVGMKGNLMFGPAEFALARYNLNGSLDSTFGNGGKVTTSFPNATLAVAKAVAIDQQGRIVVAGYTSNSSLKFALARYNPDGSLDLSFSNNGKVQTDFPYPDYPSSNYCTAGAVAIDYLGRIVVAGTIGFPDFAFALARYNSDGSLDPTFNNDGRVFTKLVSNPALYRNIQRINAITIDAWGRIVAAGQYTIGTFSSFVVLRYNPTGDLDVSFNGTGIAYPTFNNIYKDDKASGVAIDSQGRIVVAGKAWSGASDHFALARLNYDGTPDNSFNGDGKVITSFGWSASEANAVMIDGNGKILAAGSAGNNSFYNFALARYHPDGSLDNTFTSGAYNGLVTTNFSCSGSQADSRANAIAMQYFRGGSRIILAGSTSEKPCLVLPSN